MMFPNFPMPNFFRTALAKNAPRAARSFITFKEPMVQIDLDPELLGRVSQLLRMGQPTIRGRLVTQPLVQRWGTEPPHEAPFAGVFSMLATVLAEEC